MSSVPQTTTISDQEARDLAFAWQDPFAVPGLDDPLCDLARSGAIDPAGILDDLDSAADALTQVVDDGRRDRYRGELGALRSYVAEHGPRGPVAGWDA